MIGLWDLTYASVAAGVCLGRWCGSMQFVNSTVSDAEVINRKRPMTPVCIPTRPGMEDSEAAIKDARDQDIQVSVFYSAHHAVIRLKLTSPLSDVRHDTRFGWRCVEDS